MAVRLSKESKALGLSIHAEQFNTEGRNAWGFATQTEAAALDKAGFVHWNQTVRDGDKVAVILSETGVAHFKPLAEKAAKTGEAGGEAGGTVRVSIDPTQFQIRKNVPIPEVVRGAGRRESRWPWESFETGDSIFVPKSADVPDPFKSLKSTISAVNRKYTKLNDEAIAKQAVPAGTKPKTWQIAPTTEGGVDGAVIHRIA